MSKNPLQNVAIIGLDPQRRDLPLLLKKVWDFIDPSFCLITGSKDSSIHQQVIEAGEINNMDIDASDALTDSNGEMADVKAAAARVELLIKKNRSMIVVVSPALQEKLGPELFRRLTGETMPALENEGSITFIDLETTEVKAIS